MALLPGSTITAPDDDSQPSSSRGAGHVKVSPLPGSPEGEMDSVNASNPGFTEPLETLKRASSFKEYEEMRSKHDKSYAGDPFPGGKLPRPPGKNRSAWRLAMRRNDSWSNDVEEMQWFWSVRSISMGMYQFLEAVLACSLGAKDSRLLPSRKEIGMLRRTFSVVQDCVAYHQALHGRVMSIVHAGPGALSPQCPTKEKLRLAYREESKQVEAILQELERSLACGMAHVVLAQIIVLHEAVGRFVNSVQQSFLAQWKSDILHIRQALSSQQYEEIIAQQSEASFDIKSLHLYYQSPDERRRNKPRDAVFSTLQNQVKNFYTVYTFKRNYVVPLKSLAIKFIRERTRALFRIENSASGDLIAASPGKGFRPLAIPALENTWPPAIAYKRSLSGGSWSSNHSATS